MEGYENVFIDGTDSNYNSDNIGVYDDSIDNSEVSEENVNNSSDTLDYRGYFDDIVENLDNINTIMLESSENTDSSSEVPDENIVDLNTIHSDLTMILIVFLCFLAIFVGHSFVNRFRNL